VVDGAFGIAVTHSDEPNLVVGARHAAARWSSAWATA
jgi:glucosamine 6-phosphate synthetase-like amidotransferase/phosphosugar isomerase protein